MIKIIRYIVLMMAVSFASQVLLAESAADKLPIVELLGNKYYVYTAKKGESMFGIANKFGWNLSTIQELNPSLVSPFKKGTKIYYLADGKAADSKDSSDVKTTSEEIRHIVRRGETVYGLATMYEVPVETIYSLNPSSRNGIKAGESLLIHKGRSSTLPINDNKPVFYTVKSGDTLYKLAKDYGVSVAALMQANPGVSESNFKSGSIIKIPVRGTGVNIELATVTETNVDAIEQQKVQKKDTWASISEREGVPEELLKEANPDVTELKNNTYISVPRLETVTVQKEMITEDPREQSEDGLSEIYEDVHKISDTNGEKIVRVAVICYDPTSNKDAEYLRGFLTGIDRLKREDFHIDFKVLDGNENPSNIMKKLDAFKPTIIFLTSDNDIPSYMSEYASVSQTPVVNVFDTRSSAYTENPYIVQLLTPPTLFNDNIAHYIKEKYDGRTIIFVGEPDKKDLLAESLKSIWNPDRIRSCGIDDIMPHRFQGNGKYIIYAYPVNKTEVSQLLANIKNVITERPLAEINTIGRPNLIVYEESMESDFHNANTSIPSRFYIDKESSDYKIFISNYRLLFDRMPVKSLPLYAAVGYDNSTYFIPALAMVNGDINKLPSSHGTVQSNFELWRTSNWSGFINPPVFMIDFTPYGSIDKNVISYGE